MNYCLVYVVCASHYVYIVVTMSAVCGHCVVSPANVLDP